MCKINSVLLHALQFYWTQNMNYHVSFANFSIEPSDPVCSIQLIQLDRYLPELSRVS